MSPPDSLMLRPSRVIPAVLLALLALVIGGIGVWIFGARLIDGVWPAEVSTLIDRVANARFDDPGVTVVAVVVAVIGIVLLLCALIPGDPANREVLNSNVPGRTAITRRDFARRIQRQVELVDGVSKADVAYRGKNLRVIVTSPVDAIEAVKERAVEVVDNNIARLRPVMPVRPYIRVQQVR